MKDAFTKFLQTIGWKDAQQTAEKEEVTAEQLTAATAKIESLTADLKKEQEALAKVNTDLQTTQGKVTSLEADLKKEQVAVAKANSDLETVNKEKTTAQTELDKYTKGGGTQKSETDNPPSSGTKKAMEFDFEQKADEFLNL